MMPPLRSYLVCATPRSGSTLLCHLLAQTGLAGQPEEYFEALRHSGIPRRPARVLRPRAAREHHRAARVPRDARRSAAAAEPALAAGELRPLPGLGAGGGDDPERRLRRQADVGLPRRLRRPAARDRGQRAGCRSPRCSTRSFPDLRYVQITRRDKVRQAVSLWKAVQTQAWRAGGRRRGERVEPVFSFRAINFLVRQLTAHDASWDAYFLGLGARAAEGHLRGARRGARARDRPRARAPRTSRCRTSCGSTAPRLTVQADERSEEWVRRFEEHLHALEQPEARVAT